MRVIAVSLEIDMVFAQLIYKTRKELFIAYVMFKLFPAVSSMGVYRLLNFNNFYFFNFLMIAKMIWNEVNLN